MVTEFMSEVDFCPSFTFLCVRLGGKEVFVDGFTHKRIRVRYGSVRIREWTEKIPEPPPTGRGN